MSTEATVLLEAYHDGGVVLLTLNRPEARNALSTALREAIVTRLHALAEDPDTRAVVLTGSGEAFCAGFDLKELREGDPTRIFADARAYHHAVHTFPKPLVAAINGPALAGGMDLAAMCDFRVAAMRAEVGQPQVRMGIPAAYDLIRTVMSEGAGREICLTGDRWSATEALAAGFVRRVLPDGELLAEALALGQRIAETGAGADMKARFVAAGPALFSD